MRTAVTPADFPDLNFLAIPTYDEVFKRMLDQFKTLGPEYAYFLASDPVVKVLRTLALHTHSMYALLNDRARATLLTHATGIDLDAIGQFYGVTRMVVYEADNTLSPPQELVMESDGNYRSRIADGVVAFSSAGPAAQYRFFAMSADPKVKDAIAYSPDLPNKLNFGGRVAIAVLSSEGNGVASLEMLANVRAAVLAKDVKVVSDIVEVESATLRSIDLVADITLDQDAPPDIFKTLRESLTTSFAKTQRLGWDAPRSWFTRVLCPEFVYEVNIVSPSVTPVVMPNQFPYLNSVELRFKGFAVTNDWDVSELDRARTVRLVNERYVEYAVQMSRTMEQVLLDLILDMKPGIVQPTLASVGDYLGITQIRSGGVLIDPDEIALLIFTKLTPYYARGYFTAI